MTKSVYYPIANQIIKKPQFFIIPLLLLLASSGALLAQVQTNFLSVSTVPPTSAMRLLPNGYGEQTYASWRSGQGVPGNPNDPNNNALYLQKATSTTSYGAATADIEGFEGQPTSAIQQLQFHRRTDGACTATSPRFSIRTTPLAGGPHVFQVIPCATMLLTGSPASGWEQRTSAVVLPILGTITSIELISDDGDDITPGFSYLDNITITAMINGVPVTKTWGQPADNPY